MLNVHVQADPKCIKDRHIDIPGLQKRNLTP